LGELLTGQGLSQFNQVLNIVPSFGQEGYAAVVIGMHLVVHLVFAKFPSKLLSTIIQLGGNALSPLCRQNVKGLGPDHPIINAADQVSD
jgi:hypothetical protein